MVCVYVSLGYGPRPQYVLNESLYVVLVWPGQLEVEVHVHVHTGRCSLSLGFCSVRVSVTGAGYVLLYLYSARIV